MKMEMRRKIFGVTPIIFVLSLPLLCFGINFIWGNYEIPFHPLLNKTSFSSGKAINRILDAQEFFKFHLGRLVRGDDRRALDATGFACDKSVRSVVCVSYEPIRINTSNMTVYIPSDRQETVAVRPYASRDELKQISPVHMLTYTNATSPPPPCRYNHRTPAVIFSSGSTGNVFHEINDIIIPLFITTKQFGSRVIFVLEDYKPSFVIKYREILSSLSRFKVMNPATNRSVHCFPGSVVGLKYHDDLALNSSEIPGGYAMPDFQRFLRQVYNLKFVHVSKIPKPRLLLLSRTKTRRFLNEDEMITLMEEVGFEVIVVRRLKVISNLKKISQLVNSCSVLVGAHGAGLTNEIFLPWGGVMIQIELLGTEWASKTYYGDTARAMGVHYLRYKIEADESSLSKLYGRDHSIVRDPYSVERSRGVMAFREVYLYQQNVRVDLVRFRETIVEALSIVTDWVG